MAYFDNAATTFPKPEEVYVFADEFYRKNGVNVGRGQHRQAAQAYSLVADTRTRLLRLFHSPAKNVVFTNSATEAINIVLRGIELYDGCNIYISPFEHNAVTRVLHYLQGLHNINIIELAVNRQALQYDLESIRYQFEENRPHLLALSHASNVCGLVAPIHALCALAKGYSATTIIDMAQTAGLIDTDLSTNVIDYAIFAGHKTLYSPFGVAGFICGTQKPAPLLYGGTGVDSASLDLPDYAPERYEVGSQNIMAIAGLNASLRWIEETGISTIASREKEHRTKLIALLSSFSNIQLVGWNDADHIGVISCVFDGYSSDNIGHILSEYNIAVRTGLHCSPNAHKFLGTFPAGTVRFSVSYFNTAEDFSALEQALVYINENS